MSNIVTFKRKPGFLKTITIETPELPVTCSE